MAPESEGKMRAAAAGLAFLAKRAGQALLVMVAIAMIAFAVRQALGDPLREIMGEAVPEAQRAALRHELGLDAPWPAQLADYLGRAVKGDLGRSYIYKRPTLQVVLAKFPASFELVLAASLIILLVSLPAGVYCAVRPRSFGARLILGLSVLGISVPVFLTGILLITIFSVRLGWLPAFGRGETVKLGFWETGLLTLDGLKHLILPALTLASIMLPLFIRLVRGAMLDQLGSDYVRTARAKGASRLRVWLHHALRNALIPLIAVAGLQIGNMLAFTLLTETVFQWPGMGFLFLEAVTRADVPLITTYLIAVGLLFVITNTLVDGLSLWLDPRINLEGPR
jgi:peptide/nickel transport system permease protein